MEQISNLTKVNTIQISYSFEKLSFLSHKLFFY